MKLVRLEVEQFRRIRGPVEIALGEGLNVLHGHNEIGKTSLVEAAWCALTMPGRGQTEAHRRIVPDAGGTPRVTLEFTADGADWTVVKHFGTQGRTVLRVVRPGRSPESFSDDDAEERLREIARVGKVIRGEVKGPERHQWALVWVRQGEGALGPDQFVLDDTTQAIRAALARATQEVIDGPEAAAILARVDTLYERYFTETGKPRTGAKDVLAAAERTATAADAELAALTAQRAAMDDDIESMRSAELRLADLATQTPLLVKRLDDARLAVENVRKQQDAVAAADARAEAAIAEHDRRVERRGDRQTLTARLAAAADETRAARQAFADACGDDDDADALQHRRIALASAARDVDAASREAAAAAAVVDALTIQSVLADVEGKLTRIETLDAALQELAGRLAADPCDDECERRIAALHTEFALAREAENAAGASVTITALAQARLTVDGAERSLVDGEVVALSATGPLQIVTRDVVIDVAPGAQALVDAMARRTATESALRAALDAVGCANVDVLHARARERRSREAERVRLSGERDGLPRVDGPLRAERNRLRERLAEARSRGGAPAAGTTRESAEQRASELAATAAALRATHTEQAAQFTADERANEAAAAARGQLRLRRELAEAAEASARASITEHVGRFGDDASLDDAVAAAKAARDEAVTAKSAARAALSAATPDDLRRAFVAAERALAQAERETRELTGRSAELRGRLAADAATDLDARLEIAHATAQRARSVLAKHQRDAAAVDLLRTTLRNHKRAAEDRFREPLQRAVSELLRIAMPGAALTFDDDAMQQVQLTRGGATDTFGRLSAGASEQVGILVRLAMALVLAETTALPVVLDDALVVTDDDRMTRMIDVLHKAAESLQIVLVTCHWPRLRALGLAPHHCTDLEPLLR